MQVETTTGGIRFNHALWQSLPMLMELSQKELSMRAFGVERRMESLKPCNITLRDVAMVCNALRIPFRHFVSPVDGPLSVYERSYYVVPQGEPFVAVEEVEDGLTRFVGIKEGTSGLSAGKLARRVGISVNTLRSQLYNGVERLTVDLALRLCSVAGRPWTDFVNDGNEQLTRPCAVARVKETPGRVEEPVAPAYGRRHRKEVVPEREETSRWRFNADLLLQLPEALRQTDKDTFCPVGIKNPACSVRSLGGNLLLADLLTLCNLYNLSTRLFICREGKEADMLTVRRAYERNRALPSGAVARGRAKMLYRQMDEDLSRCKALFGVRFVDVVERIGVGTKVVAGWRRPGEKTLRMDRFMDLCNALDTSPYTYISDPNPGTPVQCLPTRTDELEQEVLELKRTVCKLKGCREGA